MEQSEQRLCPHCGTPAARKAETCLMCGAELREPKKRRVGLPQGDVLGPLLIVVAVVVLWLWKPWETDEPQAIAPPSDTPTATALPSATYEVAPTATPLHSPTPPPTATLPPDQTHHTVESGQTVTSIAKLYGATKKAVLQANSLRENSIINVGDVLVVPLPVANTSTPTPTLTPSPTPFEYTVRTADTLSAIAKKYGTTVEALMQANGITDASRLQVASKLIIVMPPDYSSTMAYETYEVEPGDTLYTLSSEYGLPVDEIKEINDLKNNTLRIGQELRFPVGTATPIPTLTPAPTLTPTPGPPRPAPVLLAPTDGNAFDQGAEDAILLNWASVGILDQDEWYVVHVQRMGRGAEPQLVWTKATSWRLPPDLYVEGLIEPLRFRWWVSILRQTGVAEDGTFAGEERSPPSEARTFSWE